MRSPFIRFLVVVVGGVLGLLAGFFIPFWLAMLDPEASQALSFVPVLTMPIGLIVGQISLNQIWFRLCDLKLLKADTGSGEELVNPMQLACMVHGGADLPEMKATESLMTKPTEHDPGTPNTMVPTIRLRGRTVYRKAPENTHKATRIAYGIDKSNRVVFWLGWYDERLRKWYGR